jgi:16S rRNA (cytosine967-C5)-methyltransferase
MTPGARIAAAIEILDEMGTGTAAEAALTRWARRSRFAGSKDRAAIRDHVFDVLRSRLSAAHLGKGDDGRALMIGLLRLQGVDPADLFTGDGHAPAPLSDAEAVAPPPIEDTLTRWNLPDWLVPLMERSLGEKAEPTALAWQERAPITLRVNQLKSTLDAAIALLAEEGVAVESNPLAPAALTVLSGARKIRNSRAYQNGHVEFQDAASQAVVAAMPEGRRVLDYCAGGGGKALALARPDREIFAHDIDPRRMADLPVRAERAGADVSRADTDALPALAPFDVVLCDAPCSGSGAWRRSPEGKWAFTAERCAELNAIQDDILEKAADLVAPEGWLVYATCSIFRDENEDRVAAFLSRHPDWISPFATRFDVTAKGDGFFTAHLTRKS